MNDPQDNRVRLHQRMAALVTLSKRLRAACRLEDGDQADPQQDWPNIMLNLSIHPLSARAALVAKRIADDAPVGSIAEMSLPDVNTEEPLPLEGSDLSEWSMLHLVGDGSGNGIGNGNGQGKWDMPYFSWDRSSGAGDGNGRGMAKGSVDYDFDDAPGLFRTCGIGDGAGKGDGTGGRAGSTRIRIRNASPTRPPRGTAR